MAICKQLLTVLLLLLCTLALGSNAVTMKELWAQYHWSLTQFVRRLGFSQFTDANSLVQIVGEPTDAFWNDNKYYVRYKFVSPVPPR